MGCRWDGLRASESARYMASCDRETFCRVSCHPIRVTKTVMEDSHAGAEREKNLSAALELVLVD